ncbi:hypothetical protein [Pedobacter nototheniae]|uniref:hypothetical protein n=1 Tax=Pedobacter nototheniae TaxID=2488994 RepID=UPI00292F1ED7|nr:hypothetical protein [Pedobacter nototheniae]
MIKNRPKTSSDAKRIKKIWLTIRKNLFTPELRIFVVAKNKATHRPIIATQNIGASHDRWNMVLRPDSI